MARHTPRLILLAFVVIAVIGGIHALRDRGDRGIEVGTGATDVPELEFCTNPAATTPQLPVWAAVGQDSEGSMFRLRINAWRQPAQLQTALLAGKGDLWLGHIDGIARARAHGAPVVLVAVTGWRKMSVVSYDAAVVSPRSLLDTPLPYAPKGSPAVPLLRSLLGDQAERVKFEPYDPKQLALLLAQRKVSSALLPEPLVSTVLGKMPDLKFAFALEDAYAEVNNGRARIPWAGLAVHERIVKEYPERLRALIEGMKVSAERLQANLDEAGTVLPAEFADAVASDVFRASLARDRILVEEAASVRAEIRAYLEFAAPEIIAEKATWVDEGFLWGGDLHN